LLREACAYRPFNDVYWWNLGVELRKLGRYEEALEVFKYAQSVKRTPSTAANIKWIEKQMSEVGGPGTEDGGPGTEGGSQGTEGREWIILDPEDATADPDLVELLERMGE
jgi:tetratricopeptide (TPR) repeat protein